MAEVLITLAIIGVVAALTIPSVINSYRKQTYVTQLKKTYSEINKAFKTTMAREGVYKITDTTLWSKIPNVGGHSILSPKNIATHPELRKEFEKIFKVVGIYEGTADSMIPSIDGSNSGITYKTLEGSRNSLHHYGSSGDGTFGKSGVYLADGTYIYFYVRKELNTILNDLNWLIIDVNGAKGPNVMGRDAFIFILYEDGSIHPDHGVTYAKKGGGCDDEDIADGGCAYHWLYNDKYFCNPNKNNSESGDGCAARIMEEGWQMNY